MTDWATRINTREVREMETKQSELDVEATIAAIRQLVEENRELLPADIAAVQTEPAPGPIALRPAATDRMEPASRHLCSAALLPALVPADEFAEPRTRGLLQVLRGWLH
jgi:hypothetical protein